MTRVARRACLSFMLLPLIAAAPSGFSLQVPAPGSALPVPPQPPAAGPPSLYQPAPLPNRDAELAPPRASNATTLAPSLFTRPDEYRGDGFSKGSTAQSEQEKRLRPGAGFSLKMPLSPN
jgi:hypothetical protein